MRSFHQYSFVNTVLTTSTLASILWSHVALSDTFMNSIFDAQTLEFNASGTIMEDYTYLHKASSPNDAASQWNTRRGSLEVEMEYANLISLELDMAYDDDIVWRDAYVNVNLPNKWEVNVGKMKQRFGISRTSSLKNQLSPERPMTLELLELDRAPGISVEKGFGNSLLTAGYYEADNSESPRINSSLASYLYESADTDYWMLGASFAREDYHQSNYRVKSTAATDVMDDFLRTEKIKADNVQYFGISGAWQSGPITLLGEAIKTNVNSTLEGDRTYSGAYVQTSWFLTPDRHRIEQGVLKRVRSTARPAVELVSTFSTLDAFSHNDGFVADTFGVGLNVYFLDRFKIMTELNQLQIRKGDYADESGLSAVLRLQIAF